MPTSTTGSFWRIRDPFGAELSTGLGSREFGLVRQAL